MELVPDVVYEGHRYSRESVVTWKVGDGVPSRLSLYLDKVNHSPTGFEWGYYGSGPSQLAFAILYSFLSLTNREKLVDSRMYMQFKQDVIAKIQTDSWTLNSRDILEWFKNFPHN